MSLIIYRFLLQVDSLRSSMNLMILTADDIPVRTNIQHSRTATELKIVDGLEKQVSDCQ
jgi:hypothetical protein